MIHELRNLKKLIYSGDEKNIELAIAMNSNEAEKIYKRFIKLKNFAVSKWHASSIASKYEIFWDEMDNNLHFAITVYESLRNKH